MTEKDDSTQTFTVSEEEAGTRLDKLLSLHYPEHSRSYFAHLIAEDLVLVNSTLNKKRDKPRAGDEIEVCFTYPPELSLAPENIPLDILFEDEHLIAVNKPTDLVVHPAPGHRSGTFVNALLFHCQSLANDDTLRPGIVHRIDKDTSGVLIAAKTVEAHRALVRAFAERRMEKTYLAICVGCPKEGPVDAPIGRHPVRRKEMCVSETGREAKSVVRVLGKNERLSLVEVDILTGRTHQIRVHLKHLGAPVLGDAVYGSSAANKKFHVARQLLHAHRLSFEHPITGQRLTCVAPPPKDLKHFLEIINNQREESILA
ncbi:MAG: RluA family pseudouridine synthase [Chlamydiota bacterium]